MKKFLAVGSLAVALIAAPMSSEAEAQALGRGHVAFQVSVRKTRLVYERAHYETRCERVFVPGHYERDCHGRLIYVRGRYEMQEIQVFVPGRWVRK